MKKNDYCIACKAGFPLECRNRFSNDPELIHVSCIDQGGKWTADDIEFDTEFDTLLRNSNGTIQKESLEATISPKKVFTSYHPGYTGSKAPNDYLDPISSGRKEAVQKYPIQRKQGCDWAYKQNCGGGPHPIVGCPGRSAEDIHHGPDKNTLRNTRNGPGEEGDYNLHHICHECHNTWHAQNDPFYGERPYLMDENGDPILGADGKPRPDASKPFLPIGWEEHPEWLVHDPVDASLALIMKEEQRRLDAQRKNRNE